MRYARTGKLLCGLAAAWLVACAPAGGPSGGTDGTTRGGAGTGGAAGAPASAAPTSAPALRQFELPLASSNATMLPFWVAAEYGIFRRHGLDPQLVNLPPATATQAVTAGSVPVGATGGSTVSAFVGGATELVFIAGVSNKAPFRIVVAPDILRMEDLRGKALGMTTPGASPTVATIEVLRRNGLEPDRDVQFTYLREVPASIAALFAGTVQGVVTGSPQAEYALADGANRVLVDMRELNIPILGINVSTTRANIEREPEFLRRFLMAYIEGIQYARDHPDEALTALMRGARVDDRQIAEAAYREYYDIWDPWPSEAGIQTLLDSIDLPAAKTTRPAEMIDTRFMRELQQSGWLAQHLKAR